MGNRSGLPHHDTLLHSGWDPCKYYSPRRPLSEFYRDTLPYLGFRTQDNVHSSKIPLTFPVLFPFLILSTNNIQVNGLNIISMIPRQVIPCTHGYAIHTTTWHFWHHNGFLISTSFIQISKGPTTPLTRYQQQWHRPRCFFSLLIGKLLCC